MAFPPTQPIDFVEEDYIGFYNRAGDAPGANFWVNQLNTSNSPLGVAVGFAVSSESTAIYPYLASPNVLDPTQYITSIYTNVLGRAPDAPGLMFWGNELSRLNTLYTGPNGTVVNLPAGTKLPNASVDPKVVAAAQLLTEMLQSVNMQTGTPDALLMGNRITVAEDYTTRTGDAGVNFSQASAHAAILATNSDPASVTTAEALTSAYIAGGGTGQVFTLTTAVDAPGTGAFATLSPNGNNNQIFGTFGAGATYTAGDQIVGTAGSIGNVLTLSDGSAGGRGNVTGVAATVSNISNFVVVSNEGVAANTTAGFAGLTNLNVTSAAGGANSDQISAAATTNVTVNDTATRANNGAALTVNGGLAVNVTETNIDNGTGAINMAPISIGATTAAAGAITVTNTDTIASGGSTSAAITVNGGAGVTVNNTINEGAPSNVGAVTVTGGAAPIAVTETVNFTAGSFFTNTPGTITTNGGTTVAVTEAVTQAQTITGAGNQDAIVEGAVTVNGGAATTTVSITQANVAAGSGAVAASAGTAFVAPVTAVAAAPGVQAVVGVPGVAFVAPVAAVVGTPTVFADGVVTIADKNNASTATSTITTASLSGYGNSTFTGAALNSLSLAGTGGTLSITNGAGAAATNTTLALALNGLTDTGAGGANNTITDTNNEITTLAITAGASASKLDGFIDGGLKAVTIAGSSTVTLGGNFNVANDAALKTIAVSGAAGLTSANLAGFGANLALTTTSSGTITATLDDTTQTFLGSTGRDIISLAGDATKAITGGSATNNEVILTSAASTYTAAKTGTNVTGFEILGVNDGTAADVNTYDLKAALKGYTAIDLQSAMTGAQTFTGVTAGTSLGIDANETSVTYQLANTATPTSSVSIALGLPTATAGVTVGTLSLIDNNSNGIPVVNLIANAKAATSGVIDTVGTLADAAMTALNISGNGALSIGTINLGQPGQNPAVGVPALAISNTSAAFTSATNSLVASTINTLTDDTLGTLSFSGSNGVTINTLNDNNATNLAISSTDSAPINIGTLITDQNGALLITNGLSNLTFSGSGVVNINLEVLQGNTAGLVITNSGTATDIVNSIIDIGNPGLSTTPSLTVNGNVQIGANTSTLTGNLTGAVAIVNTSGVTVDAHTDNAHISLTLSGAAAGNTDTMSVGNGNNVIQDLSVQGHVSITVGTGQNYIDLAGGPGGDNATAASYLANVTLGAHTGPDQIVTVGAFAGTAAANTVINGAAAGDVITVHDAGITTVQTLGAAVLANAAGAQTLAQAISIADAAVTAHSAATFTFGTNTYLVESIAAGNGTIQTGDTVVELVGTHTLSSTITAGHLTLLT